MGRGGPGFAAAVCIRDHWDEMSGDERPTRTTNLRRLAWGSVGFTRGCVILVFLSRVDWSGQPFLVEHSAKVLALFLALVPATSALVSIWRLLGGRAREPMDNPFAARTPADFWWRYNRPTHQFFYEDIFKPVGGLRSPIRATLITFAVSAIVHEYVFGIVIGRVEGYQTAFFLLHGIAVAATLRVKPQGYAAILWIIATYAFNLTTSVLFFASVNSVVPFYWHDLPTWLKGW